MLKLTFDMNCIIDLENKEGEFSDLQKLVSLHKSGQIEIGISAIGASERLRDNTFAKNFREFRQRIQSISTVEFSILKPPWHIGITYLDWMVFAGDATNKLEHQINDILFPGTMARWADQAKARGLDPEFSAKMEDKEYLDWRNRQCDTLSLWCHIWYKRDVFVTGDRRFHKATKKPLLIKLGAKQILYPHEAVSVLR